MTKRIVWLVVSCLIVLLLLSGCGVAKEEHDAVVAESEAAQARVASLQSELNKAQSQIEVLENALATTESTLATTQDDLDETKNVLATSQSDLAETENTLATAQSNLAETNNNLIEADSTIEVLQQNMAQAKILVEIVNMLFVPALTGELFELSESEAWDVLMEWRDSVKASGDPVALEKFEAMMDSSDDDELVIDFLVYILTAIPKKLE